jgi:hypothetical protein
LKNRLDQIAELVDELTPYPGKTCGGCTACCSVVPVRELGTKAWQRCPHVRTPPAAHVGCSIYADRPGSCRLWICGWLGADWPDKLRPDRCGVIVDPAEDLIGINGRETVAARIWVLPGFEEAWNEDPVRTLILSIVDAGYAVLWDMPPDPDGQRLARVFWKDDAGRFSVGPPTPATGSALSEAERYWRARELRGA